LKYLKNMADLHEDIKEIHGNLEEAHQLGEDAEVVEGNDHAAMDLFDYSLKKDTGDVVDLRISNCPVPDRMSRVPPPARANAGWGLVVKPVDDDGSKDLWMVQKTIILQTYITQKLIIKL
jgi:hypothetical protein